MRTKLVLATSAAAVALLAGAPAMAACSTTTAGDGTVTLICSDTITNSAINHSGNNPSTNANYQAIEAPLNATVNSGATVSGWGLIVYNGSQPASTTVRPLNVVNNGTVSHTVGWDDPSESDGFNISSNSGSIRYSGNGSVTTNGTANAAGNLFGSTALAIQASGVGNSVTVGSQPAPISATFSGEAGLRLIAENGRLDAWFTGGSITSTRQDNGFGAFSLQAADNLNLTMTGGTVVNGGISASLTAGPGHSTSSLLTITTDAHVTSTHTAGAGLTAFSREAGADVTLASGASFNVANIGVALIPTTGQSRFTAASGSTINQTGSTGALRTGLWFTPSGTGSLAANLSGTITASGTGMILQPANGAAAVTINSGGSVSGGVAVIQLIQSAGATGAVSIANAGSLSGPLVLTGSTAGTAVTLNNSGTMSGRVSVSGSSAASLITNSGTWNLGAGDSAFSGSLSNSGTLNLSNGAANTLTINGNLTMSAGSVFRVDVGATQATTDRVVVTGTATLAGSVAAFGGGAFTVGSYTLLTANGGRTGTFTPLTTTPSATAALRYDANNVFLDITAANPGQTFSFSSRDSLAFNAATVTTNRTNAFSTQILGRLVGGAPLFDQTFAAPFADPTVQNGVTAARAAITTAGGPGVIIGAPVRTSSTTTSSTVTGASTYSLAGPGVVTTSVVTTFGPATIQTGAQSTCNVSSLPSTTRPTCTTGGTTVVVGDAIENFNTITATAYTINETRTDTVTDTLRETYEINGQVVAVGSIHAEVQSGMFDLGGRLLTRMAGPADARSGWAEGYAFRVSQSGRREARGGAAGIVLPLGENLTATLAIDHGQLDIDVPGAREDGEVRLTQGGASLHFAQGPFTASMSATYGGGDVRTRRTIIGASAGGYDVRVAGLAADIGYAFALGGWTVRPVAGFDFVQIHTDGFRETDTLGLVAPEQSFDRVRGSAGVEVARDWGAFDLTAWARYLSVLSGDERSIPVAFAVAPDRVLDMTAPSEPDTALVGARARFALSRNASLWLAYDGRFGDGYTGHAGTAGVSFSW